MPLMQRILLTMPTFALGAIMIFGSIAASAAGLVIVRRCIPIKKLRLHNDVAGFIFTTIGVIYGVILAFLVVEDQFVPRTAVAAIRAAGADAALGLLPGQ